MLDILHERLGNMKMITLMNTDSGEFVSVNADLGASIHQVCLRHDRLFNLLDGYRTEGELRDTWGDTYKGAKLSPFPNMLNNGKYIWQSSGYQLPCNWKRDGHAMHGLVAGKSFTLLNSSPGKDRVSADLFFTYAGGEQGYPFPYDMRITYTLDRNSRFTARTIVTNTGRSAMPYGDGWHPYFALGENRGKAKNATSADADDALLQLPVDYQVATDKRLIPTGQRIKADAWLNPCPVKGVKLDTCFKAKQGAGIAESCLTSEKDRVSICVWQETGPGKYNYLVVYIPPERNSIAIEPMSCMPDAFNNKEGLIVLQPSESFDATFGIYLKRYS